MVASLIEEMEARAMAELPKVQRRMPIVKSVVNRNDSFCQITALCREGFVIRICYAYADKYGNNNAGEVLMTDNEFFELITAEKKTALQ